MVSQIEEAAGYGAKLLTLRVALHAACRESLLSARVASLPSVAFPDSSARAGKPGGRLERLEGLWAQMHGAWVQLKAYEAARAAEEAEMYKNRNKSTEIKSQDVRGELVVLSGVAVSLLESALSLVL